MKNLKKNKKGFTLVEIVVVLVIIAILAAAGIPALLGFIDDAKAKAYVADARAFYVAGQYVATEQYAQGAVNLTTADAIAKIESLSGLSTTAGKFASVVYTVTNNSVSKVVVTTTDATPKVITINAGGAVTVA